MGLYSRVFSLLTASLPLLAARGSDSDSSNNGNAPGSGSAPNLAASCDKARTRASTCFASDPQKVTTEGDEDCKQIDACYGKVFREGVRDEVAACIAARDCAMGWGGCLDDIPEAHASDEGVSAFLSKCNVRSTECNERQNTYLMKSDCLPYALIIDRAAFEACIEQPCKSIEPCLSGLAAAACDR